MPADGEDDGVSDIDYLDDGPDDEPGYCELCHNTGELDCHCGGDLCVCERYGTFDCPRCSG